MLHYCVDMIIITQSLAKHLFRLPMIGKGVSHHLTSKYIECNTLIMMVKFILIPIGCYFMLHYCVDMIIITQSLAKDLFSTSNDQQRCFSSSDIEIHRMQHSDHDGKNSSWLPLVVTSCYTIVLIWLSSPIISQGFVSTSNDQQRCFSSSDIEIHRMQHSDHDGKIHLDSHWLLLHVTLLCWYDYHHPIISQGFVSTSNDQQRCFSSSDIEIHRMQHSWSWW